MNSSLHLQPRTFPARVAELGFTTQLPADWISHELPQEDVDFSDPTNLLPLGVVTAPHAAIIFAFAARPAYDDGTLHDWAWFHLKHHQLEPRAVGRDFVAGVPAVSGEAVQQSELGPMIVRFAFLEDGNRLLNLSLTAPELLADSVRDAWFAMLKSFTLETPRGSRFPREEHPDLTPAAPIPEPWLDAQDNTPDPIPNPGGAESNATEPQQSEGTGESGVPVRDIAMSVPEEATPKKCRFSDFALEDDTTSLDPATSINDNLISRGVGLVPNIVEVSEEARRARVACGAILGSIDVPYGWHVLDDGRRVLVFEPTGQVQISLNLIPTEGRSSPEILDALEAEMRRDYPDPEFFRGQQGRVHALGARNLSDGGQPLEQYHLLLPYRDDSMVLRARITTTPERSTDACTLGELIADSYVFPPIPDSDEAMDLVAGRDPEPEATSVRAPEKPEWWQKAVTLEAANQLAAAEQTIRDGCPYIGFASSTAEMYRLRMLRLKAAGDEAGAREAFLKASDFIWRYASMATSGGEGAALSLERDEFRAQLVREFGSDPEAQS